MQTFEVPGYQVMQYLGRGAGSTIWQIRDRRTDAICALKRVIRRSKADDPVVRQVLNESHIAGELDHPVMRRIYRTIRVRRWLQLREIHLVMEYCEGQSLQDNRPESIAEVVRIFVAAAEGLVHMNERGFVHADTKPNNIIVAGNGTVKLIDFGHSCRLGTIKPRIQGTPDFIAPEQVHRRPLDARTDVFNLGAALYWTLTGKAIPTALPRKGEVSIRAETLLVPAQQLRPDIPRALDNLITDCVETHPSRRPASVAEVSSRLGLIAHALESPQDNTDKA